MVERVEGYRITALCDPIEALHERALAALARSPRREILRQL